MRKPPTEEAYLNRNQTMMLIALSAFLGGALFTGITLALMQGLYPATRATPLRESDIPTTTSDYKFIDPLIGIKGVDNSAQYNSVDNAVAAYIATQKGNGLSMASVDFRDINQPGGFILNPSELYTPASLNKVPLMMAYYKVAETDPSILSEVLEYSGAIDGNDIESIKSAVQLSPGTTYTVEQLIEHMIRFSDNNAANLLTQHLKDTNNYAAYASVFSDLGINPSVLDEYTDNMTVQQYSIFLRALYNATYLSRTDSEHALELLSETDFSQGIEAGVPNSVSVAEKFGEVKLIDNSGNLVGRELNNCGIVYYPDHPYLLCIMTKSSVDNLSILENEVSSISSIVYKNMQNLYP